MRTWQPMRWSKRAKSSPTTTQLSFTINNYTALNFYHRHHNVLPLRSGLTWHVTVDNCTCTRSLALALDLLHTHTRAHSHETHGSHKEAHARIEHRSTCSTWHITHIHSHSFTTARTCVLHASLASLHSRQMQHWSTMCCLWVNTSDLVLMSDTGSYVPSAASYLVHTFTLIHIFFTHLHSIYRMHFSMSIRCNAGLHCDKLPLIGLLFRCPSWIFQTCIMTPTSLLHSFSPQCHAVEGGEG